MAVGDAHDGVLGLECYGIWGPAPKEHALVPLWRLPSPPSSMPVGESGWSVVGQKACGVVAPGRDSYVEGSVR
jgi:hypothetical protein